ncbi:MAG: outer membrane protein assembly factor BamA [Longimicrobiales bacterium]
MPARRRWLRGRVTKGLTGAAAVVLLLLPSATAAQDPVQLDSRVLVDTVRIEGNVRVRPEVILSAAGIRPGQRIDYRDIQRATHRVWALGQFSDVQVLSGATPTTPDEPVELVIRVAERPYVAAIEFRGLENVSAGTVRDTVGLEAGQPLQPAKVEAAKAATRELLADKGIWVQSIDHRLEELPNRPGEHRLVFDVAEGQRVAIADIVFEGNEVFSDEALRDAMSTREEGFFWFRQGRFDEEQVRRDLRETLPQLYGAQGHIDFVVTGDSLVVDPETGKARLVVNVAEGPQYVLSEFEVVGNRRFATAELERYFEMPRGGLLSNLGLRRSPTQRVETPFDRSAFESATQQVRQLYNNYGYLYAQVEPVVEKTMTTDGRPAVEVAWRIVEGDPAYVNRITIVGNTFTHESVIRDKILLLPGDVYSEEALVQSYQSISGLGFFETPMPTPNIEPTDDGDVNVTFEVKEKQTGSVNFGTAIGGYGGLSGFLGYDQPNLFGQAKSGHLRWEFGRYTNNFEASYSDPSILGSLYSGSLSVFSARNSFGQAFRFSEGEYRRTGTSARFGFPMPHDRFSRAFIGYAVVNTQYRNFEANETTSLFQLPDALQSTLSFGVTRTTLDHPLFPTAGTRHEVQIGLTGGPLGGDGDFQKYEASGSWYVPVASVGGEQPGSRPIRFTLGLNAEIGAIVGDPSRFPFERFWMGGVQFGNALRGYDETTITPLGYFDRDRSTLPLESRLGDAFLRLSAEYAVRLNDNLSAALFYDAGNVWSDPAAINPTRLFRGAGLGATLVTPFGPLGLDFAYGFDKPEPGWQLHFKFGPVF